MSGTDFVLARDCVSRPVRNGMSQRVVFKNTHTRVELGISRKQEGRKKSQLGKTHTYTFLICPAVYSLLQKSLCLALKSARAYVSHSLAPPFKKRQLAVMQ